MYLSCEIYGKEGDESLWNENSRHVLPRHWKCSYKYEFRIYAYDSTHISDVTAPETTSKTSPSLKLYLRLALNMFNVGILHKVCREVISLPILVSKDVFNLSNISDI